MRSGTALAPERLRRGAQEILGRALTDLEVDRLVKYVKLLIKWQRSQRLVGSADPGWIVDHIVLDSLLFARFLPSSATHVLDIGSGAGVPGIPLKVVLAATDFTLLEARAKRVSFLATVVRELGLSNCEVLNRRLEAIVGERAAHFDAIVMRCVGDPTMLGEAALRLLRPAGMMVVSGPPTPRAIRSGEWRQVEGPTGRRHFWTTQQT